VIAHCEGFAADMADMQPNEVACHETRNAVRGLMMSVLERGIQDGSIRRDVGNPGAVATCLWGFVHGVIILTSRKRELFAREGLDSRQLLEQAMVMATRSIAA
jgi:hypothetical protein